MSESFEKFIEPMKQSAQKIVDLNNQENEELRKQKLLNIEGNGARSNSISTPITPPNYAPSLGGGG